MGYELRITRCLDVDDNLGSIDMDAWLQYCKSDTEMEVVNIAEAKTSDGSVLSYQNNGLAI